MTELTFDVMWERAKDIPGYFSPKAARKTYQVAMSCAEGSEFVEIGSYCGRSSAVLGQVAKAHNCHLTCIDNFMFRYGLQQFLPNLHKLGVEVTLMMMASARAVDVFQKHVDLLLVDGQHSAVQQDLDLWLPHLVPRGWLLVHDYGPGWPAIKRAVNALDYQDRGVFSSLAVRRKIHEHSDPVSVE